MENQENHSHLDLLQLYKKCQNELSFFELDEQQEVTQNVLDAFMANKPIDIDFQQQEYVSPLMIVDVRNHLSYPLCFFKIKAGQQLIYDDVLPELNRACLDFLKEMNVPFEENFSLAEISSWYTRIHSYLYVNDLLGKVKIVPYFTFHHRSVLSYNNNYSFLNHYIFGKELPKKYDSLFKEIKNEETENKINDNTFGFFAREQRVLERLSAYDGAKTLIEGGAVFDDFVMRMIDTFNEKKESLLFVVSPAEKDKLQNFLSVNGLSELSLDLGSVDEKEIIAKIQSAKHEDISPSDEIRIRKIQEKEDRYAEFLEVQKKTYSYPKAFRFPSVYQDVVDNYSPELELTRLDVEDYSEEDSQKDHHFFEEISSLDSIKASYVSNHPFYGLSLSAAEESYQEFTKVLKECQEKLTQLRSAIENKKWIQDYHWQIHNFQECLEVIEHGKILSQYNGFPRKYFRIRLSEENKYDLKQLKKAFQAVSSSRLLMENLFGKEIFKENIPQLLVDYRNQSFFVRQKAKKKIASYVSYQKEVDFDTVVSLLETYLEAVQNLSDLLPEYRQVYGENVSNMNGVVEIESNIKYVNLFNRHQQESHHFSADEPCIKRCLKDKTFRLQVIGDLNEISLCFDQFLQSIKEFNNCFRDSNEEISEQMSFDDMMNRLNVFSNQSYETYYQYAHFRDVLNESSTTLQLMVRKNMAKKKTLERFRRDYYLSLLKSFQYRFESNEENYTEEYTLVTSDYLDALKQEEDYESKKRYSSILMRIEKEKKEEEYQQNYDVLSRIEKSQITPELKRMMLELLISNYPLAYITSDQLYLLPEDLVDNSVMINSSLFDSLELISSYRVGKKNLFISYGQESDKRNTGYHEATLNKDSLYYRNFDYSPVYDTLIKQTRNFGNEVESPLFPFVIEVNQNRFALLPELLVKYPMDGQSLLELAQFLAREENIYLFAFDVYYCLFDDQNTYDRILNKEKGD